MLFSHCLRRARSTPEILVVVVFLGAYLIALGYLRRTSFRDPSSAFFDPSLGFDRAYSTKRQSQAVAFIDGVSANNTRGTVPARSGEQPSLCVGLVTVQRENVRYFKSAVGSILEGLSEHERRDIYLAALVAHTNPYRHLAYNEKWLHLLFDHVVTYASLPETERLLMENLERTDHQFTRKPLLDYIHVLQTCLETSAPYIMIVEDDVLALDGWLYRTKLALHDLEQQSRLNDTAYMRLFYTDKFLGWNSEHWPRYLFWSWLAEAVLFCVLLAMKGRNTCLRRYFAQRIVLFALVVCGPACIVLYFAAGTQAVSPLPKGLIRLNQYGCCSQALVYPRDRVPDLIGYYKTIGTGKVDTLTESYADKHDLTRWALVPALFQHIGAQSATRKSGTGWAKWNLPPAASIWNSQFELNDAVLLRKEHRMSL